MHAGGDKDALVAEYAQIEFGVLPASVHGMLAAIRGSPASTVMCLNFWAEALVATFPVIARLAVPLLGAHATSCASERNWSLWGNIFVKARNRLSITRAEKLVFIRGNSKALERVLLPEDDALIELLSALPEAEVEE